MKRRPDTPELLEAARRALLSEVVPVLSGGVKYAALMVASAIATAQRDLAPDGSAGEQELALFRALYGATAVEAAGADPATALPALNRRLAAELRAGEWDAMPETLEALLLGRARLRIARSNPAYLAALDEAGRGGAGGS